jgi:hypothetical protein
VDPIAPSTAPSAYKEKQKNKKKKSGSSRPGSRSGDNRPGSRSSSNNRPSSRGSKQHRTRGSVASTITPSENAFSEETEHELRSTHRDLAPLATGVAEEEDTMVVRPRAIGAAPSPSPTTPALSTAHTESTDESESDSQDFQSAYSVSPRVSYAGRGSGAHLSSGAEEDDVDEEAEDSDVRGGKPMMSSPTPKRVASPLAAEAMRAYSSPKLSQDTVRNSFSHSRI